MEKYYKVTEEGDTYYIHCDTGERKEELQESDVLIQCAPKDFFKKGEKEE